MEKPEPIPQQSRLRVAVLVDLPRSAQSGGHVKCWERLANAAALSSLPLDLTVYFSGAENTETLSPFVRLRQLPPVFSSANLKFLPYMPDTTDLAPYHPTLARELLDYDVIHTTDGFFAFAQTAARISRTRNIPLVTSFHTDTPAYTRIFTQQAINKIFSRIPLLRDKMIKDWNIPEKQGQTMERKLKRHVEQCYYALVTREEDHGLAERIIGKEHVKHLRLGVDKAMFGTHRHDRTGIEQDYSIPKNQFIALFVGRVDVGKNIYTLIEAMEKLIAEGFPVHLIAAGIGPATTDVRQRLGSHATLPGFVKPDELARLYASVDVLTLSSEVEIRSMAGVEAMASGCPVLVSKKSGIAELFNYTAAMEAVESGPHFWAQALRDLAATPEKRQHMHTAATTYSHVHLASWGDVLAEDLFSVWQKAAQSKESKAA